MKGVKIQFGLTAKLLLLVSLLLLGMLIGTTYLSFRVAERRTIAALERQGDAIASSLNHSFEVLIQKHEVDQIQRVAVNTLFLPDVDQVTVVDKAGVVIACTDRRAIGKSVISPHLKEKLKSDDFRPTVEHEGDKLVFTRPLFSGHYLDAEDTGLVGAIEIVLDRTGMQVEADDTVYELLGIQLGGYAVLAILLALALRGFVNRPLQQLYEAAQKARAGDRSARSLVRSNDEIGVVSRAFDELAEAVEQTLHSLEAKVSERTESLQKESNARRKALEDLERAFAEKDQSNAELAQAKLDLEKALQASLVAKQAAEAASVEALAGSRAKSEFLAAMSHEIRTPMNGVIGMATLLLDSKLNDEQREFASIIRASGQALLGILGDILDFSKIESGKIELELRETNIRTIVEETLDVFAANAADKGVELAYCMDGTCPEICISDPTRLRQILTNLVGNALKFTNYGDVLIRVEQRGEFVYFAVRDQGIGIPEELQHRLFQPFSQVDASTTRRFGGTGLGLAISKRLVELLGGEIGVESKAGEGSTFYFTIALRSGATQSMPELVFPNKSVVVVDLSWAVRESLRVLLSGWGLTTKGFSRWAEARAWLSTHPADVVLLDAEQMPEEAQFFADRPFVLVLMSSIRRLRSFEGTARVGKVLTKPIKLQPLYEVISQQMAEAPVLKRLHSVPPKVAAFGGDVQVRILLVEDNVINQKVAMRMLERLGYTADVVGNGMDAVESVRGGAYDIVFMDIQMPLLDGLEATRQIRQCALPYGQPWIIAMTAEALNDDEAKCRAAGMDEYVTKPVQLATLGDVLRRGLEAKKRRGS